tara:strand:- start:5487 stop:6659 length:1173 start_codon:yes stop_codon:yes gene_type:complete
MDLPPHVPEILASAKNHLDALPQLRDVVLANAVFCGEIPSPTFGENKRISFLSDRFTESGVESSVDEVGNVTAIVPGKNNKKNILLAAHADTLWDTSDDHAVTALTDTLQGIGLADNSLGVAAMASLPLILERLGIQLDSNLILLGAVRSLGRGDLEGLRFFLDHTQKPVHGAVCIEGAQLGRLSHSCLGMVRGKITVTVPKNQDWKLWGASNAITSLHQIIDRILAIGRPDKPRTQIILGSVRAGSGYNSSPERATLRFEVRSESEDVVQKIQTEINQILDEVNAHHQGNAELSIIAQRTPGNLGYNHPLVTSVRAIMDTLKIPVTVQPSMSELSALLVRDIPSVTLGLTHAEHYNELNETVQIEPLFKGLAQVIATLQVMDQSLAAEA